MNENKDKLSLMDGEQLPVCLGVAIIQYRRRIRQSMSKAGCPYDNSPMESFYGTFKSEFIRQNRFGTDHELNESTLDYVYGYYNHIRPHSSNGYMTPFEKRYSNQ